MSEARKHLETAIAALNFSSPGIVTLTSSIPDLQRRLQVVDVRPASPAR